MKIAIIGAGSIVFCKTLILDLLNLPQLGHLDFALMAPSTRRTDRGCRIPCWRMESESSVRASSRNTFRGCPGLGRMERSGRNTTRPVSI